MENIKAEIEDKVLDCINSGVSGRLIIFKPEKNSLGADLAIERRGNYKEREMYFQINSFVGQTGGNNFTKDFPEGTFRADPNFYLLFVYFNEFTQKIHDHIWLIPSLQFKDMAPIVKSADGKDCFRFQSSMDIKDKNDYSKFAVESKQLGKMILDAFGNGGRFVFKETDWDGKRVINLENLKEFICEARQDTYASDASPIDNPRLLASKQLEFQKASYYYRDIYFLGDKNFIGQEIVYQDSKPVWAMNYIGNTINKVHDNFLKESLYKLVRKCRFGGNCEYEKRELKYKDQGQGNLEGFSGYEEILISGKEVYKLNYQGGMISEKL